VSRLEDWLGTATARTEAEVVDITLTSDDPEDLTLRQARALGRADTVLHDPAMPEPILIRARADAARHLLPADPPAHGLTVILRRA
jgi:uroporphyrin-III C-methyltransferase/precorrin-2 dehydrogenase/sirohydrochlorin ferrochelatase